MRCGDLYVIKAGQLRMLQWCVENLGSQKEVKRNLGKIQSTLYIRESVDSLCRDGTDTLISLYKQNPSNLLNTDVLST